MRDWQVVNDEIVTHYFLIAESGYSQGGKSIEVEDCAWFVGEEGAENAEKESEYEIVSNNYR